ncbi:MAG: hypothetical protein KHZ47_04325 [Rothia mucilaginosa]|nr:hypothetical protein [Rothia mucilaginosa]
MPAFAVDLHVYFGDAAVVELAGFESPVPPFHGGLILLDVERVNMDGHKPKTGPHDTSKDEEKYEIFKRF